jgi:KipI family sensor histidine kinase inhibitor
MDVRMAPVDVRQPEIQPRFLAAGDSAVVVEFGSDVSQAINELVLMLDRQLWAEPRPGIVETIPTYRSLMVIYDPVTQHHDAVVRVVEDALAHCATQAPERPTPRRWTIPVVYGGKMGFDLAHVAAHCRLTEDEVIAAHSKADYRVFMIGFNPGFPYLGGLPERLHIPRRAELTPHVEPGSIIIGGMQAAITSVVTPTGWYVIGRTPIRAFDIELGENGFLFRPGDVLRFAPIPPAAFAAHGEAAPDFEHGVPELAQ